ncbi:hypothetical protein [Streptodolium elevatio]
MNRIRIAAAVFVVLGLAACAPESTQVEPDAKAAGTLAAAPLAPGGGGPTATATSASPTPTPTPTPTLAAPTPPVAPPPPLPPPPAVPTAVPPPRVPAPPVAPAPTRAPVPLPATSRPAPPVPPAQGGSCEIVSNAGNCYNDGQFCRKADLGRSTHDRDGEWITCKRDGTVNRWIAG